MKVIKFFLVVMLCVSGLHTVHAETLAATTTRTLLTFQMPNTDTEIERINHALLAWKMKSGISTLFPVKYTNLVFTLVSVDPEFEPLVISDSLKIARQGKTPAISQFKEVLSENKDRIPVGEYRIEATLAYDYAKKCRREGSGCTATSTTDAELIELAALYKSVSSWFTIALGSSSPSTCGHGSTSTSTNCGGNKVPHTCADGTIIQVPNTASASARTQLCTNTKPHIDGIIPVAGPIGGTFIIKGDNFSTSANTLYIDGYTTSADWLWSIQRSGSSTFNSTANRTAITFTLPAYKNSVTGPGWTISDGVGALPPQPITPGIHVLVVKTPKGVSNPKTFIVTPSTTTSPAATTTPPVCNSEQNLVNGSCVNITTSFPCPNGITIQVPAMIPAASRIQYCANTSVIINAISPSSAARNADVTIVGSNLWGTTLIEFYTAAGQRVGAITPSSVSTTSVTFNTSNMISAGVSYGAYKVNIVTNRCTQGCASNRLNFTLNAPATAIPTITAHVISAQTTTRITNNGRIQAVGGAATFRWTTTGNPVCTLNDDEVAASGTQSFTGMVPASYVYACSNSAGSVSLNFSIEVPVVVATTTTGGTAPVIRIYTNGERVRNGNQVPAYNGELPLEWGGTGATSCTLNGSDVPTSGAETFSNVSNGTYVYTCSNSAGSTSVTFSIVRTDTTNGAGGPAITVKPSITIKADDARVRNGKTVESLTGTVKVEWGTEGASYCRLNGAAFPVSGLETYTGLTTTDYTFSCANAAGTTTIKWRLEVPVVLGASSGPACTALPYNLHRGHESVNVKSLQEFLRSYGLLDEVTSFYGDKTVAAVKAYQLRKGLPQTGMVFEFTRAALRADSCQ